MTWTRMVKQRGNRARAAGPRVTVANGVSLVFNAAALEAIGSTPWLDVYTNAETRELAFEASDDGEFKLTRATPSSASISCRNAVQVLGLRKGERGTITQRDGRLVAAFPVERAAVPA